MARSRRMVVLVLVTFFVISILTNILGSITPDIITSFHVSLTAAGFLAFAFFIAYGVMSIPTGFLVERFTEKPVMIAAFMAGSVGSLSFALFPQYRVAVVSLFVIGAGMAALQVAINPLLRVAGGEEHFAFNSALAQLVFGSASFVTPRVYSYLVLNLEDGSPDRNAFLRILGALTPSGLPWVSMYWILAALALLMVALLAFIAFPAVQYTAQERPATWQMYRSLARQRIVWMYFLGIFSYVGCEQGTATWISKFLNQYHGVDPHTAGAAAVSWFWGLMTGGCFAGMLLLKIFDSRKVLIGTCVGALLCLSLALFGPGDVAVVALPAIGLFASVMWPIVFSLGLNSVSEYHGAFAGILVTGIVGGAIVPVIIGRLGDQLGLRAGVSFLYILFAYLLSIGFWARPLINNAVIDLKQ